MSDVKIAAGAWVVVCDGAKAVILRNAGDGAYPDLRTHEVFEQDNPSTEEQGTDRPGRSYSSVGPGRSAMEQTDWHDLAEQRFLKRIAEHLHQAAHAGEAKQLIIVAPPRALGVLRQSYTPAIRNALQAELDKDLAHLPNDQLEKHLKSA